MNEYELCVLFSGQQTQEETDELAKQVEELLKSAEAEVVFNHSLGRKKLAYAIKTQTHGEYRCWLFSAESANIPALNEKLRLSQSVMRHLISKFEHSTIKDRIAKIKDIKKPTADLSDSADSTEKEEKQPTADLSDSAEKKKDEKKPSSKEPKISLDQLDEKLDELLESDKI